MELGPCLPKSGCDRPDTCVSHYVARRLEAFASSSLLFPEQWRSFFRGRETLLRAFAPWERRLRHTRFRDTKHLDENQKGTYLALLVIPRLSVTENRNLGILNRTVQFLPEFVLFQPQHCAVKSKSIIMAYSYG